MTEILNALRRHANNRGLVILREAVLCEELSLAPKEIRPLLHALAKRSEIEILSSLPFLVVRVPKWRGIGDERADAYSYQHKLLDTQQDSYRPGNPSAEDLLGEILETLGETDGTQFRKAVENYAPTVIRTALDRVRRAKRIRKNRTALFRHLLPRIAQAQQPNQPNVP